MLKCVFNSGCECTVSFVRLSPHAVCLCGENVPTDTSGFMLSREGHQDEWDYRGYTTIYSEEPGRVAFSDDGSIYDEDAFQLREPEQPAPTPTDSERITALEEQLAATKILLGVE